MGEAAQSEAKNGRMPSSVRWLSCVVLAVATVPFVQFLTIALSRLSCPLDIEWMEGAVLGHGIELIKTGSIYKLPSQEFVPFIYPPLYAYVTALGIGLTGIGFTFARLISLVSVVGTAALVGWLVWKENRNSVLAGFAFLTPFAAYGVTGYWFDLVRVDGMALLFVVGSVFALLNMREHRGANVITAAALLALASFGKQSFALFALALALHLVLDRNWRGLAVFAIASAVVNLLLWGSLFLGEGRLAFTYIFEVPRTHGWWKKSFTAAFSLAIRNLYMFRPILVALSASLFFAAWRCLHSGNRGRLRLLGLFALAAVAVSLLTRAKWGGYENAFIPAYFLLGLLGFYSAGVVLRRLEGSMAGEDGGGQTAPAGPAAPVVLTVVLVMILISSVTGALSIDVGGQRVTHERRFAARQLAALVRAVDGRVLMPTRNAAVLTGCLEDNHYHAMASRDLSPHAVLFPIFEQDNERGLESGRFPVIIVDRISAGLEKRFGYRRVTLDELGIRAGLLGSLTGKETRPKYLYYREGVDLQRLLRAVRNVKE
ncbi:MAG: DUF2029 domain-containing protein [Candidatus Eisenbacteria sp.]|nr:DUF2029 domain-containing protein [Candidatus Eisenbacteria bacterium]